MRILSTLAFVVVLGTAAASALAQGTNSIEIGHPWARATPSGATTGAVYMTLKNQTSSGDRLTGGSSPVADTVQIHEMKVENGVMHMRELPNGLAVPAKGSVTLKPGSYHVMLIGLKQPLKKGEHFPLALTFEKAGSVAVDVRVEGIHAK